MNPHIKIKMDFGCNLAFALKKREQNENTALLKVLKKKH